VAESAGFEIRYTFRGIVGSNPTLSAKKPMNMRVSAIPPYTAPHITKGLEVMPWHAFTRLRAVAAPWRSRAAHSSRSPMCISCNLAL
jgi:hypothetical protein